MPTVCHFEIPADDPQRAKRFYEGLFGWKIEGMPGMESYLVVSTTDHEGKSSLGGGIMKKQHPEHRPTNYIDVPSVDDYAAKAFELGGQIAMPKTAVPGMGYFAVCVDTDGKCIGLWETDPTAE